MEPAISLSGVGKTFGATVAVRDLDLVVPTGALYGFIGPNGAGKTTSLRMIMSILFPDQPELLILDEPFSGLDPVNTRLLRDIVLDEHRRGTTILFSTHIMTQAEELCDHILMLHRGRKVLDDSLDAIRRSHDPRAILFEPFDPAADVAPLGGVEGVAAVAREGTVCRLDLIPGADAVRAMRAIALAVAPSRIELQRPSLEDIFVELVTGAREPAGAAV